MNGIMMVIMIIVIITFRNIHVHVLHTNTYAGHLSIEFQHRFYIC